MDEINGELLGISSLKRTKIRSANRRRLYLVDKVMKHHLRVSGVGVMLVGVGSAITGCSAEDVIRALLLLIGLGLGGSGTDTGGSAAAAPPIVFYDGGTTNGNMGGRSGANAMCVAAATGVAANKTHKVAYLSVSSTDQLSNHLQFPGLPTNVPLVSLTGEKLAMNWADALDQSVGMSLIDANIFTVGTFWWSGSTSMGILNPNCTGWTISGAPTAFVGNKTSTNSDWLNGGQRACSTVLALLCVAY